MGHLEANLQARYVETTLFQAWFNVMRLNQRTNAISTLFAIWEEAQRAQ